MKMVDNGLIAPLFALYTPNLIVKKAKVNTLIDNIYFAFYGKIKSPFKKQTLKFRLAKIYRQTLKLIKITMPDYGIGIAKSLTKNFVHSLLNVKITLEKDLTAFCQNDPASQSRCEIITTYPGFHAIFVYRIAHRMHILGAKLLARTMAEIGHTKTGIDIHPSAKIGEYFFIDHGTGVVIGETAQIGNHVKIYQGVTLGASSLKDPLSLCGKKRHPTILDGVTIYANATILGGNTIIEENRTVNCNSLIFK